MSKLVSIWYEAVFKYNIGVLYKPDRQFALNFGAKHSFGALFDNEGLYTPTFFLVAGPDDYVTVSGVTNPSLLSVEDPTAFNSTCCCLKSGSITANSWLGQSKAKDLFEIDTLWNQPGLLLFVTEFID